MLTDKEIKSTAAGEKPFKLSDSGGLYLYVTPAGGRTWRLKYRHGGVEKTLKIGSYPTVTLAEARRQREDAKALLAQGRDPSAYKKAAKAKLENPDNGFEAVARRWHEMNKSTWVERHAGDVIGSLETEIFPSLGKLPIHEISVPDVLAALRKIEARGAKETARRVRQRMSAVFVFGIGEGICKDNPAAIVQDAMAPLKKGRQPAITDLDGLRKMLAAVDETPAHPVTKLAIRILALTAVRPGTLAATPWAEWDETAIVSGLWNVPPERLKMKLAHKDDEARALIVPLSTQTIEAIEALRVCSGRGPLAFPNARFSHKPMSENAMGYLLNRAGYHGHHVPHGFRASFSSIMNERHPSDRAIIDLMLAHVSKDKVEGAYNRALHLARRKELAQEWADTIMEGAPPAASLLDGPRR